MKNLFDDYTHGVKQPFVAINKMDYTEPPYSQDRIEEIQKEIKDFIKDQDTIKDQRKEERTRRREERGRPDI